MTRVVRIHGSGGPEVLKLENIDVPAPGGGEVSIRISAIGLNRAEIYQRQGLYGLQGPGGISAIGSEAAGVIEAVGPDVQGFAPGDAVTIFPGSAQPVVGTYAERIVVRADAIVAQPSRLTAIESAALWAAYLTAYAPMVEIAKVGHGDVVLVTAASSSVGLAAINIVKVLGGTAVAVTRTRAKAERLKALGAAHVIVTDEENLADRARDITDGAGARVAFDPIAGPGLDQLLEGVASDGILVHYGMLSQKPTFLPSSVLVRNLTIAGYALLDFPRNPARRERALRFITQGVAAGAIKPAVDQTFPLEEAAAAHAALESNGHVGKIVLVTS